MSKTKKFYIIISVLFVINSILTLTIASGSYLYLLNMSTSLKEQEYYGEMLAEKEKILSTLKIRYEAIKDDLVLIKNTLPEEKEASELISDLNAISKKSDLIFTSVKADTTDSKRKNDDPSLLQTKKSTYGYEMPLIIEVKGPYNNFVSFVKSIENYQRLINITSIDLKRSSNGSTNDEIEATLKITVYLKK